MSGRFTVFLDRDGVFCPFEVPGTFRWEDWRWLPGVQEAFARLAPADGDAVQTSLCTNQPMVGMLAVPARRVRRLNRRLQAELADAGGRLDHIEAAFAPPWFPSRRRKPRPGMLESAARHFAQAGSPVDKTRAVMIGDTWRDAGAAAAYGVPFLGLATTHDEATLQAACATRGYPIDTLVDGLPAAVDWILDRL